MLKRLTAWVLTLALLMSVMPQLSLGVTAEGTATPPEEHSHSEAQHECEHCGKTVTWTATNTLPNTTGHYYLTGNVTVSNVVKVTNSEDVVLCLNGYNIDGNGVCTPYRVEKTAKLTIADCTAGNVGDVYRAGRIQNGYSGGGIGGAFYLLNDAQLFVYDVIVANNRNAQPSVKDTEDGFSGGAIRISGNAKATLKGVVFTGNTTTREGGAIVVREATAKLIAEDCVFENNKAGYSGDTANTACLGGGAIYIKAGTAELTNCTFKGNKTPADGGAIYAKETGAYVKATGCTFESNQAKQGGAISAQAGKVELENCTFKKNTSTSNGGALYVHNSGTTLEATGCTFTENTAAGGSAVYANLSGVTLTGCTFEKNEDKAATCGAVYLVSLTATVDGCSFKDNQNTNTKGAGGSAIYITGPNNAGSTVTIKNCTVSGDKFYGTGTDYRGAIYVVQDTNKVTLEGKILIENVTMANSDTPVAAPGVLLQNAGVTLSVNGLTEGTGFTVKTQRATVTEASDLIKAVNAPTVWERQWIVYTNNAMAVAYDAADGFYFAKNTDHIHCQCGDTSCSKVGHETVEYIPWPYTDRLPQSGEYYLTDHVTMTGECEINGDLNLCLNGFDVTAKEGYRILSTPKDSNFQVVISDHTATTTSDGVYDAGKLMNGKDVSEKQGGGAIYIRAGGTLKLFDGIITGNTAVAGGGAVLLAADTQFTMYDGEISNNTAVAADGVTYKNGGGIYALDGAEVQILGGSIRNNTANNGGGIYFAAAGEMTVSGGTIAGNEAKSNGGGIYAKTVDVNITGGTISGNKSTKDGAGVYYAAGNINISGDVLITGNETVKPGGGVCISGGATGIISGGIIEKNEASSGGGMIVQGNATVEITGGTIRDNTATGSAGGVYVYSATLKLSGGSITGNKAKTGGAIRAQENAALTLQGGTITGNKVTGLGGGVYADKTTSLTVQNTPVIKDNGTTNLYLANGMVMQVGQMADGASVGVTANVGPISKACEDASKYFVSDSAYRKVVYQNGALYMVAGGEHKHCLCDSAVSGCDHKNVEWAAWESTTSLPTSGSYYLLYDVVLSDEADDISEDLNLCLNGHTITAAKDKRILSTPSNKEITVSITDCTASTVNGVYTAGKLTGGKDVSDNQGGGAIYMRAGGTLKLYEGIITGNTAVVGGGAILLAKNADFTMYGGEISNNTVVAADGETWKDGGAIYAQTDSNVQILGGTIKNNTARYGGGIHFASAGKLTVSGGTIADNEAKSNGGGIYAETVDVNITGGTISGNKSPKDGAGVYYRKGNIHISGDALITGNETVKPGGGVCISGKATGIISGGTIEKNKAGAGGGMIVQGNATVEITGGTIRDNTVTGTAGGVYVYDATLKLSGGTITGNTAKSGGAIGAEENAVLTIQDGMLTGNTAAGVGGAVYAAENAQVVISGGTFSGNTAGSNAGGVYGNGADIKITGGKICDNTAAKDGGGVYFRAGNMDISGDVQITGNETKTVGGGVCYSGKATGTISGGTIEKNKAGSGGGMIVQGNATVEMTGGTIQNHSVTGSAGGVYVYEATLKLTGGTITGNYAKVGAGGVYVNKESALLVVQGGTISKNSAKNGAGVLAVNKSTVEMKSGKVTGNTTTSSGAGMYISTNSILKMTGGSVSGNTATGAGGGVYGLQADMTLSGGSISGNTAKGSGGGGIYSNGSTLRLYGVSITGNTTTGVGGGVNSARRVVKKNGVETSYPTTILLSGSYIANNTAKTGGGIVMSGNGGNMEMHSGTITGNTSTTASGGLYVSAKCTFKMTGGKIYQNTSGSSGGGVYHNKCTAIYTGGEVYDNTSEMAGGGMYFTSSCSAEFKNFSIYGNTSGTVGGGMYVNNDTPVTMTDCKLSGNTSGTHGGAIYGAPGAGLTLANCSFTDNKAVQWGGAIFARDTASLTDCVLSGNKAELGGGFYGGNPGVTYSVNGWGTKGSEVGVEIKNCTITDNDATLNGGGLYLTMSAFTDMQDTVITGNTSGAEGSGIWAEDDLTMINVTATGNVSGNNGYAVYLSDSEYDGQTYIKGLMKMGGDMIIKDNQGGDMFLGNLVTVGALSQGYGAKTHVEITLDKGVLTQRVFGAYNYEGGDQVYTITYGDRSLTEPEYDASLTANTDGEAQDQQIQAGDIALYAGVGVFVIALAAVIVLLLKKKKKAASAAEATKE